MAAIGVVYLIQAVSPLRLDHDSVLNFRMAMALADGAPVPRLGLPIAYPTILAWIDRLGLPMSCSAVVINTFFVFAGFVAAAWLLRGLEAGTRALAIVLTALSFAIIRAVALPQPDSLFFGTSLSAVAMMCAGVQSSGSRRVRRLVIAGVLAAVAIALRLAGVALLPALLAAVMGIGDGGLGVKGRRWAFALGAVALAAGTVIVVQGFGHGALQYYLMSMFEKYRHGAPYLIVIERLVSTILRLGEMGMNIPSLRSEKVQLVQPWIGLIVCGVIFYGLKGRFRWSPLSVFIGSYTVMMIVWPYDAARLWMPLVPFIAAHVVATAKGFRLRSIPAALSRVALFWFIGIGVAGLAYTTRVSFSGERFPTVYGRNGGRVLRGFESINPVHDSALVVILERYDPQQAKGQAQIVRHSGR